MIRSAGIAVAMADTFLFAAGAFRIVHCSTPGLFKVTLYCLINTIIQQARNSVNLLFYKICVLRSAQRKTGSGTQKMILPLGR